jgi:hypothetical protein
MQKAPVLLSVFDRPNHFRACIESLKKNKGAEDTVLYIASDGPICDASAKKVAQVRSYIKSIHGFKKTHVFAPKENSQKKVIADARANMLVENKIFIASEDDNIFSPFFLDFINNGLSRYEDDPNVFAICGYNYPEFPSGNPARAISLKCFAAWGYGSWRDRELPRNFDQKKLMDEVFVNKNLFSAINHGLPHMAPMMKSILDGRLKAGDVIRCALLFKENKICVFPSLSLVRNMGHDGSGEHCGVSDRFENQAIYQKDIVFEPLTNLEPLETHTLWLHRFFGGRSAKVRNWLIYFEVTSQSELVKKILRLFFSLYRLNRSAAGFAYRLLKRSFA